MVTTEQDQAGIRRAYVEGWNRTMIEIWKERIVLLGAIETGALYNSVMEVEVKADDRVSSVTLRQSFLEYGLYVDRGTGREFARGNPGDIGRPVVRRAKPWFSRKYWSSVHRLKEFFTDSLGKEFCGVISRIMES